MKLIFLLLKQKILHYSPAINNFFFFCFLKKISFSYLEQKTKTKASYATAPAMNFIFFISVL